MDAEIMSGASAEPANVAATGVVPEVQEVHRVLTLDRTEGTDVSRHILLPVDDTDDSEIAIRWAIDNLFRAGDVFHLLHVIPEPQMIHIWSGVYIPPDEDAELVEVEDTKNFVKHRFAQCLVDAKVPFMLHVIVGPVDSEAVSRVVAKKALDIKAEVVVVARHNKGRLKEFWVGSVTKALMKSCPVSLAVVPPHA